MAVHCFVGRDDLPNVTGLVVAGLADLKSELVSPKILDKRLLTKVLKLVDVSYGMEKGLHQAIALSAEVLGEVRLLQEQRLLERYFNELVVSVDNGKAACGLRETMAALREGVVDSVVCWEQLPVLRYAVQHSATGHKEVIHYTPKGKGGLPATAEPSVRELLESHPTTRADPQHWSIVGQDLLVDWLAENYREFGARLSFVSGNSELGNQFVQSFGGLGAVLRYRVDFEALGVGGDQDGEEAAEEEEEDDFDDFTFDDISSEPRPKPVDPKEEVLEFDESDFEEEDDGEAADQQRQLLGASGLAPSMSEGKEEKGKEKLTYASDKNSNPKNPSSATSQKTATAARTAAEATPARTAAAKPLSKVQYTAQAFVPRATGSATSAN